MQMFLPEIIDTHIRETACTASGESPQFGASEFLGTMPPANASVVFTVTYGSAIDCSGVKNSTGDAILQIAKG
jgi:hypothetical protein